VFVLYIVGGAVVLSIGRFCCGCFLMCLFLYGCGCPNVRVLTGMANITDASVLSLVRSGLGSVLESLEVKGEHRANWQPRLLPPFHVIPPVGDLLLCAEGQVRGSSSSIPLPVCQYV